jgi:hypothetical protein
MKRLRTLKLFQIFSNEIKNQTHIEVDVLLKGFPTKYVHIKSTTVYAPRRNWDSLQPPTRKLVCPLPPVSGGRGTLAGEKGVGRVPIPTRGIHCGTLYMYVLCGLSNGTTLMQIQSGRTVPLSLLYNILIINL